MKGIISQKRLREYASQHFETKAYIRKLSKHIRVRPGLFL